MKNKESPAEIFLTRRKAGRSRWGMPDSIRSAWHRVTNAFAQHPRVFARVAVGIVVAGVLFDFLSFSFASLPVKPGAIEIVGNRQVTEETIRSEILRKLRAEDAETLIEVDLRALSEHLKRAVPAIRSSAMKMNVGRGNMTVTVEERLGTGIVRTSTGFLEFDREGMLYPVPAARAINARPQVRGLSGLEISSGRNLYEHPAGAGLMRVLQALPPGIDRRIQQIHVIQADYLELTFTAPALLAKVDPATFPDKVLQLVALMRRSGDRPVSYIDFRFRQNVIAYAPQKETGAGKEKMSR